MPRKISFTVECSATRVGEHLRIVGSIPELGRWAPDLSSVRLSTSPQDFPLWRSECISFPDEAFEWKCVIFGGSEGARWESCSNRQSPACLEQHRGRVTLCGTFERPGVTEQLEKAGSAVVEVQARTNVKPSWDATKPVAVPANLNKRCMRLSFKVTCLRTQPGEHVRIVGSHKVFGHWTPACSIAVLQTSSEDFPVWQSSEPVLVEDTDLVEYKYVICGAGRDEWEHGSNRQIVCPGQHYDRRHITIEEAFDRLEQRNVVVKEDEPQIIQVAHAEKKYDAKVHPLRPLPLLPRDFSTAEKALPSKPKVAPRVMSWCMISPPALDEESPRLRKFATYTCLADVPEGLLPTRRSIGLVPFTSADDEGLIREAGCVDRLPPEEAPVPERNTCPNAPNGASAVSSTDTGSDAAQDLSEGEEEARHSGADETARSATRVNSRVKIEVARINSRVWAASLADPEELEFEAVYKLRGKIGEGAFGVVHICSARRSGAEYAAKIIHKDRLSSFGQIALLGDKATGQEGEIHLHGSLPMHDHIVGLRNVFQGAQTVSMVLDICRGGDLFDAIQNSKRHNRAHNSDLAFPERAAARVMLQVLTAVAFCHNHGIVHRDIKAENVLLPDPVDKVPLERAMVKLCDFGLAARCWAQDTTTMTQPVGSPDYVAPEIARMEAYGASVDIWSSGVLLFASLRGRLPFPARTDQEVLERVRAAVPVFDSSWEKISQGARACVEHLMQADATKRPQAEAALTHHWLSTGA